MDLQPPRRKKKVILITLYFPPVQSVATLRSLAFFKYLDQNQFEVVVITPAGSDPEMPILEKDSIGQIYRLSGNDFPRLADTKYNSKSRTWHYIKAAWNKVFQNLFIDLHPTFTRKAIHQATKIIETDDVAAIVTTYGPMSALKVGLEIKKKYPDVKWICDLRDDFHTPYLKNPLIRFLFNRIRSQTSKQADAITSVSDPILKNWEKSVGDRRIPMLEVRNGYDFEPILSPENKDGVFRLFYAGTFYGAIKPDVVFNALKILIRDGKLPPFEFHIFGGNPGLAIPKELQSYIYISEWTAYSETVERMKRASAFLLILPQRGPLGIFSGKIFDYLGINRPLIALVDPSDVASNLIQSTRAGYVVGDYSPTAFAQTLEKLISDWKQGSTPERNWDLVRLHHRKVQIHKMESLICQLSGLECSGLQEKNHA